MGIQHATVRDIAIALAACELPKRLFSGTTGMDTTLSLWGLQNHTHKQYAAAHRYTDSNALLILQAAEKLGLVTRKNSTLGDDTFCLNPDVEKIFESEYGPTDIGEELCVEHAAA